MNSIDLIKQQFFNFLKKQFSLADSDLQASECALNCDEQKQQFGDLTTNAAMVLAKQLKKNPKVIATEIVENFRHELISHAEIAGPGFINFFFSQDCYHQVAQELAQQKAAFFKPELTQKEYYSLEYVSANPTGPLHLGHGRGGIIGDVLGNVLAFVGHKVTKEYYINDAGAQMNKLGNTLKIRCQQITGQQVALPEDSYQGTYLCDIAQECIDEHGATVVEKDLSFFIQYAEQKLLARIKQTLADYGITFDTWFSERTLHDSGAIAKAIEELSRAGYTYEQDGALWFTSTKFGDDKDRVLRKSDGELTYVAADIAYMKNKVERGATKLIMVLGQDHHSYVQRLEGLRQALGLTATLDVILYQLVRITASGELVRMSKRTGNFVTLEEIIEMVGKDVARFFYLNRKADSQLEFNLDLALKKSEENPVFYLQYAYVRMSGILRKAQEWQQLAGSTQADLTEFGNEERFIIKKIASLKELLITISTHHNTHQLAYYAIELARAFHAYYTKCKVIDPENSKQSRMRLALITELRDTLGLLFDLLGIKKLERM